MSALENTQCEVSVCMATYNGSRYVREQINSILPQLGPSDEMVIVDDASSDETFSILTGFHDARIRLLRNDSNQGVVRSFERALSAVHGKFIFLSDQDDFWAPDKVKTVLTTFRQQRAVTLVMTNAFVVDAEGRRTDELWSQRRPFSPGIAKNLIQNSYVGCLMAFRRDLMPSILPFPEKLPMHDMWIGLVNQLVGRAQYIGQPLVHYRRHTGTVTTGKHASLLQMARWRWRILHLISSKALTLRTRKS